jgi:pimeloyl-ACP methyl ester carboxylesterase
VLRLFFIFVVLISVFVVQPVAARTADEAADACRSLQGDRFENLASAPTFIVRATWRPASAGQGGVCAVEGYVNPTVKFGLLLPEEQWNGKFLVRGCGGSCGDVVVERACRFHVMDGYACLHTDMGHYSTLSDNNWTANNLQGLVDFGYRATHVTTLAGKSIAEAYYSAKPARSYFFACSTGGRQGMVEAQRFPNDFDGIVVIAPAGLTPYGDPKPESEVNPDAVNTGADGKPILPNRKALLVHQAVIQRCDMNDGLRDGLVGDPRACKFDPGELQCRTGDARNCLTAAQVGVVRHFYDKIGAQRGSEFNWIGAWLRPASLSGEQSKPLSWLARGRGDPVVIDTLNSANNPDLGAFKANGGKLILVHGWDDQSVMPLPTVNYFQTLTRTMGGELATRDFARLFTIPGMDHCAGGKGAYAINYMKTLEDWVEHGKAPETLLGIHPLPGSPLDYFGTNLSRVDAKWHEFTRLHPVWRADDRLVHAQVPHDGLPKSPSAVPLGQELAEQLKESEAFARAALFPQATVASYMMRTLWKTFYTRSVGADEAAVALKSLPRESLSPVARDVAARMEVELRLD